jgi:hypothetical protein
MRRKARPGWLWCVTVKDNKVVLGGERATGCPCDRSMFARLTKWFSLTRLETRTKESNMYASIWVRKTRVRNESKGHRWVAEVGTGRGQSAPPGHHRPIVHL